MRLPTRAATSCYAVNVATHDLRHRKRFVPWPATRTHLPANITTPTSRAYLNMDTLDGTAALSSDMDEETQRWIEAANTRTANSKPVSTKLPSPPTTSKSPVDRKHPTATTRSHTLLQPINSNQDHNTFEESFTAALSRPQTTYDGHFDGDEYDDQTPLLNSYYNSTQITTSQRAAHQPSHRIPLELPKKSKPSLSICLWHEICHNSQYTRPVVEILREVLEERYPVASTESDARSHGDEVVRGDEALQELLGREQRGSKRRWLSRILRRDVR